MSVELGGSSTNPNGAAEPNSINDVAELTDRATELAGNLHGQVDIAEDATDLDAAATRNRAVFLIKLLEYDDLNN